jgi:hypothetical protein
MNSRPIVPNDPHHHAREQKEDERESAIAVYGSVSAKIGRVSEPRKAKAATTTGKSAKPALPKIVEWYPPLLLHHREKEVRHRYRPRTRSRKERSRCPPEPARSSTGPQ